MSLSIIIPTLNEEEYVGELLQCLVRQTYKDFEAIIVDGHSDDSTTEVVRKYKKKLDLRLINSQKRNVAYQRNLGVKKAKYENLLFLDADVIIDPDFLRTSVRQIKNKSLVVAIPKYIPDDRRWYYKIFFGFINITFWLTQKIRPCGIGICIFSAKLVHSKILGFDAKLNWVDDMDYIGRAAKSFKYSVLKSKVNVSVRRFEDEGTKYTIKRWLVSYWYFLINRIEKCKKLRYFS